MSKQSQKIGKISKPQKSGRHKKINAIDPFYTGDRRVGLAKRADQINNTPKDLDQEIPRSLRELIKRKDDAKLSRKERKKKARIDLISQEVKFRRPERPVPEFKQRKGETEDSFINRIERESKAVIAKSQFEDQYKIKLEDGEDGQNIRKRKTVSQKKKLDRLNEKKKVKRANQKEKLTEKKHGDFSQFQDKIQFGEIVHQPPSLTAKPRKSEPKQDKPGKRSLLLKEIIQMNSQPSASSRKPGEVVKRKNMSMAQQRNMDEARAMAIAQYRDLKLQKFSKETG